MATNSETQVSVRLAEKQAAKARAQKEARPISERIDDKGMVIVWHLSEQKHMRVWPVDAADMIRRGMASLDKPDEDAAEGKPSERPLLEMTIPELKELAASKGISLDGISKKADIIEAIEKAQAKEPE